LPCDFNRAADKLAGAARKVVHLIMGTIEINDIAPEVRSFVRERFKVPDDDTEFSDDVHLFDYGYVDSFGAVQVTLFVESRYAVKISEADFVLYPMNSITEIASFVSRRKKGEI
jgi:D-alanine--poly(phosphoribitol) ligase subunit 2